MLIRKKVDVKIKRNSDFESNEQNNYYEEAYTKLNNSRIKILVLNIIISFCIIIKLLFSTSVKEFLFLILTNISNDLFAVIKFIVVFIIAILLYLLVTAIDNIFESRILVLKEKTKNSNLK